MRKEVKLDKSTWVKTKLGELAEEISVRVENPSKSQYDRFVGLDCFVSGELKIKKWSETSNVNSSAKAFKAGDVLFARRNAYLKRASLVEFDGCCSGDAFVLRENHDKIVPGFLSFIVNSEKLWTYANSNAEGTMSKRVKWRDLANYEFLLPPKAHQAELAELLWAMDNVIEKDLEVLESLISLRKSENFNDFNTQVKIKKIGQFSIKVGSGVTPKGGSKVYLDSGIRFIRSQNVLAGEFDFTDIAYIDNNTNEKMKSTIVRTDDILLNITGASIGRACVYLDDVIANVNQHVCIIRLNDDLMPFYLCEFLNSEYGQKQIDLYQAGGNREGLNFENIKQIKFPYHDVSIQKNIVEKYNNIIKNMNLVKSKLQSSKALQKALINQVF